MHGHIFRTIRPVLQTTQKALARALCLPQENCTEESGLLAAEKKAHASA